MGEGSPFEFEGIDPFADPLIGTDLGPYHVELVLGQGGMGTVYKAVHRELGRDTAIKVLPPDALAWGEEVTNRFHQEAMAYARIRHPNVVQIFESGKEGEVHYLALEFVEGRTLEEVVDNDGAQPIEDVLNVGRQLCAALGNIHAKGLVHRDIKLGNLMVGVDGTVKLMDFGVARARAGPGAVREDTSAGTLRCMAPEVLAGGAGDLRADLFQVGVLLYELMSGSKISTRVATFRQDIENNCFCGGEEELRSDVPDALKELILRCLENKPALRFQSAAVLARELDRTGRLPADQRTRRRPGDPEPEPPKAPSILPILYRKVVHLYGFYPQAVAAVIIVSFSLVAVVGGFWLLDTSDGPDGNGDGPIQPKVPTLARVESVSAQGGFYLLSARWDLLEATDTSIKYSYRDSSGTPVYESYELTSKSGMKDFPIDNVGVKYPTVSWRLMKRGHKLAGGSEPVGFHLFFQAPPGGGVGPARRARLIVGDNRLALADPSGRLHGLSLGAKVKDEAVLWSVKTPGERTASGLQFTPANLYFIAEGASLQIGCLDLFEQGASTWLSPIPGTTGTARSLVAGDHVYCVTSTPEKGGAISIVGVERATGKQSFLKSYRGVNPVTPAVTGRHLLIGFSRGSKAALVRLSPEENSLVWKHIIQDHLVKALLVDKGGRFVYFRTESHLYRLRLLGGPSIGKKRLLAKPLGDLRLPLPGPCSSFLLREDGLFTSTLATGTKATDEAASPVLAKLSFEGATVSSFEPTPLPLVLRKAKQVIKGSAAPLVVFQRVFVPLGDTLCYVDLGGRDNPRLIRLEGTIISAWYCSPWVYVALSTGALYRCHVVAS